jgi:serine/threonine protein kinase
MSYGGISLDRFRCTPENLAPLLKSFLNLFEGLSLAHSKEIIHHDIKPANIVTMPLPQDQSTPSGQKYITRFIDFGLALDLSRPPSESVIDHTQSITSQLYAYFPFEQIIMYPLTTEIFGEHSDENKNTIVATIKRKYIEWNENIQHHFPNISALFIRNRYPLYNLNALTIKVINKNNKIRSYQEAYQYYFKSCDVYMLGLSLNFIFNRMNIKLVFDKEGYYSYNIQEPVQTMFSSLGITTTSGMTSSSMWYIDFQTKFLDPLLNLVQRMTMPVSAERINIRDATSLYRDTVLQHIDTILTPDNIRKYLVLA